MSANLFKKVNSSDYISYKKRSVIAGEYAIAQNTNPVKANGVQYNQNLIFIPSESQDLSNCLIQAQSYELKQDYTNGFNFIHVICDLSGNLK
jgi:hypothetical protein